MFEPFVKGWEVFSAHAEVVPVGILHPAMLWRILRARGGSSWIMTAWDAISKYSPRTRR